MPASEGDPFFGDTDYGYSDNPVGVGPEPAPVHCSGCGDERPYTLLNPPPHLQARGMVARWVAPRINPCDRCKEIADRKEAERRYWARVKMAGVPRKHRHFDWERRQDCLGDAIVVDWMRRVKRKDLVGVHPHNAKAAMALVKWQPGTGSLWIEGKPGRGKTLFSSLLAMELCKIRDLELVEKGDDGKWHAAADQSKPPPSGPLTYRRSPLVSVLLVNEEELHDRVRMKWSGDRDPMMKMASVDVLIIDDLGTEDPGKDWVQANIEKIVDYRWKHGLPLIITTNRRWRDVTKDDKPLYGHRVADRLIEMMGERRYTLGGESWRSV